ncbi:MAG: protease inhibitor I42 family protein [Opitutales bacterium]|jgi:inhibitor of cysteine peptidase
MTKYPTLLMAWLMLLLAGCSTNLMTLTPLPTAATMTSDDNGKTITVAVGSPITVTLAANPTTGYQWTVPTLQDTRVVKFVSSSYAGPSSPAMGAGGTATFVFQAAGTGISAVRLVYARPFAPQDHPSYFAFTVVVKTPPKRE